MKKKNKNCIKGDRTETQRHSLDHGTAVYLNKCPDERLGTSERSEGVHDHRLIIKADRTRLDPGPNTPELLSLSV